jgi:hypothetical protein
LAERAVRRGVKVPAYPRRYKPDEQQRYALRAYLKDAGGAAIEVVTGSHTAG